ncbi:MAG: M20/M25/M40 family metallo-hydrolase [Pyrinomonadaceae bacterium]|nr:M20/M25/M40 family metallo-hydrolase [Phycisphaerales bacterium]
MNTDAVLAHLDQDQPAAINRLIDWLRIPSISTDPKFKGDCRRAAQWCADHLAQSGLKAELRETGEVTGGVGSGHPIVMAYSPGSPDYKGPHVLFYGHYDVQPVGDPKKWESEAFEPVIREADGGKDAPGRRIVARGAVDDKGQVAMFLESLRAWKKINNLVAGGVKFTVLIEGEEESSSINLKKFVNDNKDELSKCHVCVISDTGMLGRERPAITYGVRGIAYTEVILHAADQDLHSGMWGGRAPNPLNELTKVLSQIWDSTGRVSISGFYDNVVALTEGERAAWQGLNFDVFGALKKIGLPPEADRGEAGYTALEREWGRPCCDINGIIGGYTGEGAMTVIPAVARAKVSFRLVANQDPAQVSESFFTWLRSKTPAGCRWEFIDHGQGFPATVPSTSAYLAAATRAVERATGRRPELIKSGGSIPVAGMLKGILGLDTIFMGFGLDDDRVHSPNEKFEIDCFRMGARSHAILIEELHKTGK